MSTYISKDPLYLLKFKNAVHSLLNLRSININILSILQIDFLIGFYKNIFQDHKQLNNHLFYFT